MNRVISNIRQITANRLTKILYNDGCLTQGRVVAVETVELPAATSFFGSIFRLKLQYSDDAERSAPVQLILKTSRPDLTKDISVWGKKEVDFYRAMKSVRDNLPIVHCYDAVYAPESGKSHVLLNDLSATHFQKPWPLPPLYEYCEKLIESLAQCHSYWWDSRLLELLPVELPTGEPVRQLLEEALRFYAQFVDILGDGISLARRGIYEKLFASSVFEERADRIDSGACVTLTHGDSHFGNYLLPRRLLSDRVYIIDWHLWKTGVGTNDLAFLIAVQWYPERRHNFERRLLKFYHQRLEFHGLSGYRWDDCWLDYRTSVILQLLTPVVQWGMGLDPKYWWSNLERVFSAFQDLNCMELL